MSLYWKLTAVIVPLVFVIFLPLTLLIMGENSSNYLAEQLAIEDQNDANTTASHLNQLDFSPAELETYLKSKADLGVYRSIRLLSPVPGAPPLFERVSTVAETSYPAVLKTWFPIESRPGQAKIEPNFRRVGTLEIQRYDDIAYGELWKTAGNMLWALAVATAIAGLLGFFMMRSVLSPLKSVVAQAKAIGERRFTTLDEPSTKEFAAVTRAMNELAHRVREMLEKESKRLIRQREAADIERGTGLLMRDPFMSRLRAKLESEDADASGTVALLRLGDLARLNQRFGRQTMDTVLKDIGSVIKRLNISQPDWVSGRLNGSDFCLIAPRETEPKNTAETLQRVIREVLREHDMLEVTPLPASCIHYAAGDTVGSLMSALDGALAMSDEQGQSEIAIASKEGGSTVPPREQGNHWRAQLMAAIEEKQLLTVTFPVITPEGRLIHHEGMLRIRVNGQLRSAGEFMPWVHRFDLSREIDQAATLLALKNIEKTNEPSCANLTGTAVTDTQFAAWLEHTLQKYKSAAPNLSLEISEATAYAYSDNFRNLAKCAHNHGAKIGVEHMGYRISDIGKLGDLGMDYIKIDSLFTRDVDTNPGNAALLRTYISIAQSLGLSCIAEGISNNAELAAVTELGVAGVCGRGVEYRGR